MKTQTPLNQPQSYYLYSTTKNKFLKSWEDVNDTVGKWTDQVRMGWNFPVLCDNSERLLESFKEKFPNEKLEFRIYQLQYVEIK